MLFQSARASVYFQKANTAIAAEGAIEKAEGYIFKAVDIAPNDVYYRMIAGLSVTRISNLLEASMGKTEVSDAEKTEFQNALQNGVQAAQLANAFDAENFQNKAIAGQVYETIIPVQIEGAYEMSKKLYEEAIVLSPRNPALFLALARVEAAKGSVPQAEGYIRKALELKWNYPDAIFLQSQIDISKGNVPSAIKSVQQIAALTPNDPLIFFRLGLLYYDIKNFTQAIASFEKSISLVPVYANAKYFLGLSYVKAGRNIDAVKVFTELKATNSDASVQLDSLIANIQAGKDPFANTSENIDLEKRKELPVKEAGSSEKP
jgi:tetratricopeptide (TPR) repeat protein